MKNNIDYELLLKRVARLQVELEQNAPAIVKTTELRLIIEAAQILLNEEETKI